MRRCLVNIFACIFFSLSGNCYSTVEVTKCFTHSHLNFCLSYSHCEWEGERTFYYQGVSTVLNEYIARKVENGQLANKKINVEILSRVFGFLIPTQVSQNANGYYIFIHGHTNLEYLVRLVDYFASDNWQSFCIDWKRCEEKYRDQANAIKVIENFNRIVSRNTHPPDLTFVEGKMVTVWQKEDARICYSNDEVYYLLGDVRLNFKPGRILPCKMKDRYFVPREDTLLVYQGSVIANRHPIEHLSETVDCFSLRMIVHSDWMNFYRGNEPILSYSYSKNTFYRLK